MNIHSHQWGSLLPASASLAWSLPITAKVHLIISEVQPIVSEVYPIPIISRYAIGDDPFIYQFKCLGHYQPPSPHLKRMHVVHAAFVDISSSMVE